MSNPDKLDKSLKDNFLSKKKHLYGTNILKGNSIFAGYFFAIGATALWSGNFIVARGLSNIIPPASLAFYRWLVAVIVFSPFAIKSLI